ncbi:hypothetical protein [Streptomyces sp. NPDC048473]|uniref:hypothetical protein n=1 Tax=Streptomyces sp. NPDC048473 TaxID=3365556 RepID=UPI003712E12B
MLPGKDDIGVTGHSRGGVLDEHLDRMEAEGDEYVDDFRQAVVPGSDQAFVRLLLVGVGLYVLVDQPFGERQILSADGGNERAQFSSRLPEQHREFPTGTTDLVRVGAFPERKPVGPQ